MPGKALNPFFIVPALVAVAAFGFLALYYPKGTWELWINRNTHLYSDQFFLYATELGHGLFFTAVVVALLFVRIGYAALVAATGIVCSIVTQTLKHFVYVDAPRPPKFFEGLQLHFVNGSEILYSNSFPSGHTMTGFAWCFLMSQLVVKRSWGFAFALVATAVGLSRVYLLKHFFVDVFFGAAIGLVIAFAMYRLLIDTAFSMNYRLARNGLVRLGNP
jgi:membrane-associated phospholipid phosphatase